MFPHTLESFAHRRRGVAVAGREPRTPQRSRAFVPSAVAALVVLAGAACALVHPPGAKAIHDHGGFVWDSAATAHFRLYFERGSSATAHIDALKQSSEQARARVLAVLGERDYAEQVTVFVVQSRARMKALIGKEVNGQAIPSRNVLLYVFSDSIDASGAHELFHVVAKTLWGNTDDWINEGMAVYADDRWQQRPLHAVASYLSEQGKLIPLPALLERFDHYPELVTYPEAGSFVKFLHETYGVDALKQIWDGGAAAIPGVTGKGMEVLERDWHNRIKRRGQPNER